jgi:SNF2 family DNA or RNA helicase
MAFTGTLRGFQEPAVEKMLDLGYALVAYDMGLGKTVLTIAAIEQLLDDEEVRGGLIIAGASLKYQWVDEIAKFTDGALVLVIDGTPAQRKAQYAIAHRYEYVILSYSCVVSDWAQVKKLERDFIVLDEAVAIKSFTAKRSKRVKMLDADFRYALTGQPVENSPEEVFSIMEWVEPTVLGYFEKFDRTFIKRNDWGGVQRYQNLPLLHKKLSEVMVRKKRTDPDVADEMPQVVEDTLLVRMDPAGRALYNHIRDDLLLELGQLRGGDWDVMSHYGYSDAESGNEQRGRIMSRLTCLRMLCDHPQLLRKSAALYDGTYSDDDEGTTKGGSIYASQLLEEGWLDHDFGTPKLDMLYEEVCEILDADPLNKVCIFSFFKGSLDEIAKKFDKKTGWVKFTGDLTAKQRHTVKRQFQDDPRTRLFISSDAGGVGVDLPQANYLCNYDLPWSAGKMDQRNARIIRLSSEWEKVILINFLIRGSIEERQYEMLEQKRAIASAVVDGSGIDVKGQLQLSLSTLRVFVEESTV